MAVKTATEMVRTFAEHAPWPHRHKFVPEVVTAKVVAFLVVCVFVALFAVAKSWWGRWRRAGRTRPFRKSL